MSIYELLPTYRKEISHRGHFQVSFLYDVLRQDETNSDIPEEQIIPHRLVSGEWDI